MRARQLLVTVLGMVLISSGTYYVLSSFSTRAAPPAPPTSTTPMLNLPGTIYVGQHGSVYTISKGIVGKLGLPQGTFYSQPAVSGDGTQLVVAAGDTRFTDLFLASPKGALGRRLTDDRAFEVAQNHWAFFPRFSSDGQTVFYSWDPKNPGNAFRVDLAVFALDLQTGDEPPGRQWTTPDEFTGGDVTPQPLKGGALLYAGYSVGAAQQIQSRIWWQSGPGVAPRPLTELAANCGRPAVNPAGDMLAMICSPTPEKANLVVAPFVDGVIGAPLLTIDDQLTAAPAWAPDGKGLAYYAAGSGGTAFDLWWTPLTAPVEASASASPSPRSSPPASGRRQVTSGLDLDTTSAPAWAP